MNLKGKTIAITGAARGLGRAMAEVFAQRGARLALIDVNTENLAETASQWSDNGVEVRTYTADVSNEQDVENTFSRIVEDFGTLHGLVNNAGITRDGLLVKGKDGKIEKKMSLRDWQEVIDVNLTGVFLCGREAAVRMIECRSQGVILNISSISRKGNPGQTNYAAAKAGVATMTVTWANELYRHGIRVVAMAPGFANTPMVQKMKESAREKLINRIPMRRLADPQEIAHTAVYLFENDYFAGRVIEIDGGLRL